MIWEVGDVAETSPRDEPGYFLYGSDNYSSGSTAIKVRIEKIYTANGGAPAAWVQRIDGVKGAFQVGLWDLVCDPVLYLTHCGRRR